MGKCHDSINGKIRAWIEKQPMFFVVTAPLSSSGSINLSPKGHATLCVLDEHTLAFRDYGGSGVETIAHLRENRRIVIMMCALQPSRSVPRENAPSGLAISQLSRR
jgi:hypothetical protein